MAITAQVRELHDWLHELGEIAWLASIVAALSLVAVGLAIALAAAS